MKTRYRTRRTIDMGKVAGGLKMPGIDTRTWVSLARVDIDPDATVWDPELGWLADVTMVGGQLDGDGPCLARVSTPGAAASSGSYSPPVQGALVVCLIPTGDPHDECIIVGQLHDIEATPASQVNGVDMAEQYASETHVRMFPGFDLDASYRRARLTGDITLAEPDASQPYVLGNAQADALDQLLTALDTFLKAAPATPVAGAVGASTFVAAAASLSTAIASFKSSRNSYLSTKIRGA